MDPFYPMLEEWVELIFRKLDIKMNDKDILLKIAAKVEDDYCELTAERYCDLDLHGAALDNYLSGLLEFAA